MKFLIAIVLYRIERKLTPLLKTNLSVFANVFFSLNLFSSWIYFSWYSKRSVCLRGCCFLKMHFGGFLYCFVSLGICNFVNLDISLLSEGSWTKINGEGVWFVWFFKFLRRF